MSCGSGFSDLAVDCIATGVLGSLAVCMIVLTIYCVTGGCE